MGIIYYLQDQAEWYRTTLAKKNLAWHEAKQREPMRNPFFDFQPAITKERTYLRSFFESLRDRAA